MKPSQEKFDPEKKQSAIDLIKTVKDSEGNVTGKQTEFMQQVEEFFVEEKDNRFWCLNESNFINSIQCLICLLPKSKALSLF